MSLIDFSDSEASLNDEILDRLNKINNSDDYPDLEIKNNLIIRRAYWYIKNNDLSKKKFAYRSKLPKSNYNLPSELTFTRNKNYALKCIFTFWSFKYNITKERLVEGERFSTDNMIKSVVGYGTLYDYIEEKYDSSHSFLSSVFDINYIKRAFYYDIDWERAKNLLENGLTKRALARKIGIRSDLIDEVIDKEIGDYDRSGTYIQLSYDEFSKLYDKEKEILNNQAEFFEIYELGIKDLGIPESTLKEYINKKSLKEKSNIEHYAHRKKIEKIETVEEHLERKKTYDSEEEILRSIELPIYWLHGFGADMIHQNKVVEIKKTLSSNTLYKAILQVIYGYRLLSNQKNIEEKAVYVTQVDETDKNYWKRYAKAFEVKVYELNDEDLEAIFDPS